MSDVTKFPRRTDDLVRIGARRVENGENLQDVLNDLRPEGGWEDLPEEEQKRLFAQGLFSAIQQQMIRFLTNHREDFLRQVRQNDPIVHRLTTELFDQADVAAIFAAFIELEIEP